MTAVYEPWDTTRGADVIAQHTHLEGATLVILHALQEAFGYVPGPAIPMIASALNLSRAEAGGTGLDPDVIKAVEALKTTGS